MKVIQVLLIQFQYCVSVKILRYENKVCLTQDPYTEYIHSAFKVQPSKHVWKVNQSFAFAFLSILSMIINIVMAPGMGLFKKYPPDRNKHTENKLG